MIWNKKPFIPKALTSLNILFCDGLALSVTRIARYSSSFAEQLLKNSMRIIRLVACLNYDKSSFYYRVCNCCSASCSGDVMACRCLSTDLASQDWNFGLDKVNYGSLQYIFFSRRISAFPGGPRVKC